jgi:hypothetical protein
VKHTPIVPCVARSEQGHTRSRKGIRLSSRREMTWETDQLNARHPSVQNGLQHESWCLLFDLRREESRIPESVFQPIVDASSVRVARYVHTRAWEHSDASHRESTPNRQAFDF